MKLPILPPIEPMLSKRADELPSGDGWIYEPKWDGFRTIVFRDTSEWYLQSRDLKPMARYFPELEQPIVTQLPERVVLDGEIVIATPKGLDFEALQQRIHPAKSRVDMLARQTPTSLVLWDVLAIGDEDLRSTPFAERRARLEQSLRDAKPPIHVTPLTRDRAVADQWFHRFEGAGLDGVMAKRSDGRYEAGKRTMFKIKHERTADCVVAGFRWHKNGNQTLVGSLLLGLYDADGRLHHVGVTASFPEKRRRELVEELAPYRSGTDEHPWKHWTDELAHAEQRLPGAVSRWNRGKTLEFVPLRPELVVEVAYDHMQGDRFRHTAQFRRWRKDKAPEQCRYDQLEVTPPYELVRIFRGTPAPGPFGGTA
jgi:ATP-dependent DNA ligase